MDEEEYYSAEIDFPGPIAGLQNSNTASRKQSEHLFLEFHGNDSRATLKLVQVAFSPAEQERSILKKRIGNFETTYEDELSGTYRISANQDLIVVLKCDGLFFGYESRFD